MGDLADVDAALNEAVWTSDVRKQDFDFDVVSVSSRLYPDHTAFSTIYLLGTPIASTYVQGRTDSEAKALVEAWVREQLEKFVAHVATAYSEVEHASARVPPVR